MNLSYWEISAFFKDIDICIVGSGIVGLNAALEIKRKHPHYNVLVLEKGTLNDGASSKNAGFACFGSPSELLSDLENMTEEGVINLVRLRWEGLQAMKVLLGEAEIEFNACGGFELFRPEDEELFEKCDANLGRLNKLVAEAIGNTPYQVQRDILESNDLQGFSHCIANREEGSLNTGKMIRRLIDLCLQHGVRILNGQEVLAVEEGSNGAVVQLVNHNFKCRKVLICTNGFTKKIIPSIELEPARNLVMVTSEIPNLKLSGTFHFNQGFVYFRNVHSRLMIGGFRNLDPDEERTSIHHVNPLIHSALKEFISIHILHSHDWKVEYQWTGIMGVGNTKETIVKEISPHVLAGVRLGGMGVAIGTGIGRKLAAMI